VRPFLFKKDVFIQQKFAGVSGRDAARLLGFALLLTGDRQDAEECGY
jgi:hypothetical protein